MTSTRRLTIDLNAQQVQDWFATSVRSALGTLIPAGQDIHREVTTASGQLISGRGRDHGRLEYTSPGTGITFQLSQGDQGNPFIRIVDPRNQTGATYDFRTGQIHPLSPDPATGQQWAMTDQDRQVIQGLANNLRPYVRPAPPTHQHGM